MDLDAAFPLAHLLVTNLVLLLEPDYNLVSQLDVLSAKLCLDAMSDFLWVEKTVFGFDKKWEVPLVQELEFPLDSQVFWMVYVKKLVRRLVEPSVLQMDESTLDEKKSSDKKNSLGVVLVEDLLSFVAALFL